MWRHREVKRLSQGTQLVCSKARSLAAASVLGTTSVHGVRLLAARVMMSHPLLSPDRLFLPFLPGCFACILSPGSSSKSLVHCSQTRDPLLQVESVGLGGGVCHAGPVASKGLSEWPLRSILTLASQSSDFLNACCAPSRGARRRNLDSPGCYLWDQIFALT